MMLPREIEEIRAQLKGKIAEAGAELIEIQYRRTGTKSVIMFVVDKEGGITLENCAEINRRLGAYLDSISSDTEAGAEGLIRGPYLLEVASPGLDRPLATERDFERVAGQWIRITVREVSGMVRTAVGKLQSVKEGVLRLEIEGAKGTMDTPLRCFPKQQRWTNKAGASSRTLSRNSTPGG